MRKIRHAKVRNTGLLFEFLIEFKAASPDVSMLLRNFLLICIFSIRNFRTSLTGLGALDKKI